MKFKLNKKQFNYCYKLAKQRHDAKHASFRNKNQIMPDDKREMFENKFSVDKQYMPHFLGVVGELAWSLYTGDKVDENIYSVRDGGEDFKGIEIRTLTYQGDGEPELKVKVSEYEERKPPELYVLIHFDMKTNVVNILGKITRENFDNNKIKKKYGRYLPLNYVVPLSKMEKI